MSRRDRSRYRRRPRTATGRPKGMELATPLTDRQRRLYDAVTAAAGTVEERLAMLYPLAGRQGASEADVRVVRARVVAPYARERDG